MPSATPFPVGMLSSSVFHSATCSWFPSSMSGYPFSISFLTPFPLSFSVTQCLQISDLDCLPFSCSILSLGDLIHSQGYSVFLHAVTFETMPGVQKALLSFRPVFLKVFYLNVTQIFPLNQGTIVLFISLLKSAPSLWHSPQLLPLPDLHIQWPDLSCLPETFLSWECLSPLALLLIATTASQ